jgi:geranylgeranyl diphosphate synthase type II
MHSFKDLVTDFGNHFSVRHFPEQPSSLYEPNEYFLSWGGKRIRPVMCLMGNELFDEIHPDTWHMATAIELFHNFTLIHDDIMDAAPLRRGMETVHIRYGESTALLAGDVMLIKAYEYLNKINPQYLHRILNLFNTTAREVCEGQQLDMDFEKLESVSLDAYIHMISLKTSVLLAASLEMGAVIGGASEGNCRHLYDFGKNLGIAFQVQDDYLDAFGDPETPEQRKEMEHLMRQNPADKVERMLAIFRACNIDEWARALKDKYLQTALEHLEAIAVRAVRKQPLQELANFLIQREY